MTRREFLHNLALITLGVAANKESVAALEHIYELNSPPNVYSGLIAVNEVFISGMETHSFPTEIEFFSGSRSVLNLGLNCFGGIIRWVACPQEQLAISTVDQFNWKILPYGREIDDVDNPLPALLGHIRYIDQDGIWKNHNFSKDGKLR